MAKFPEMYEMWMADTRPPTRPPGHPTTRPPGHRRHTRPLATATGHPASRPAGYPNHPAGHGHGHGHGHARKKAILKLQICKNMFKYASIYIYIYILMAVAFLKRENTIYMSWFDRESPYHLDRWKVWGVTLLLKAASKPAR